MTYKEDIARVYKDSLTQDPRAMNMKPLYKIAIGAQLFGAANAYACQISDQYKESQCVESIYDISSVISDSKVLTRTSLLDAEYDAVKDRLSELSGYPENWDGFGAMPPSSTVIENSNKFLYSLHSLRKQCVNVPNVQVTTYGTIVMDFYNSHGLVSVEIARNQIGYFTDYNDVPNVGTEGIDTDFSCIPQELVQILP